MGWYDVPRPIVPDLIVQHGRNQARKPALICGFEALMYAWRLHGPFPDRV